MAVQCCKRPIWWYIGGSFAIVIGLALMIVGILAKTYAANEFYTGLARAPYISNTHETSGCKNLFLGDTTCPGARFNGWKMTSQEKYDTCMRSSAPSSKSLASASKWCKNGSGGCSKPQSCKPGSKYSYSFFSVTNYDEVLEGHPAEIKEMEPVFMRRLSDKVHIDTEKWDAEGIAKWSETAKWEVLDDSQIPLLDQTIVVPNPTAFMSFPPTLFYDTSVGPDQQNSLTLRISYDTLAYTIAAGKFYTELQGKINEAIGKLPAQVGQLFAGDAAINWQTLVKDIYWNGSPILKFGLIQANVDVCELLMEVVVRSGMLPLKIPVAMMNLAMCNERFRGNIDLAAYAAQMAIAGISITSEDGISFYAYEKNCPSLSLAEKPTNLCYQDTVCPADENDPAVQANCLKPSLSQEDADALFVLLNDLGSIDFQSNSSLRYRFGNFIQNCELGDGHKIEPESLCLKVQEQLKKVGRAAMFKANPNSQKVQAEYGWTDRDTASKMIPYFINGTIAQVMNYENKGLKSGLNYWTNTENADDVSKDIFTEQRMSKKFGHQGISYYKSAMGLENQSCAFDHGCMIQPSFLMDGKTCVADDMCTPSVVGGYDVGSIPGYIFGTSHGTSKFHGLGKSKTMFVSDLFVQADFTQVATSSKWKNVVVDKWNITSVSMRVDNCDARNLVAVAGMDCTSPKGTINIGHNILYAVGKTPQMGWSPTYMSFPFFQTITQDGKRHPTAYDPNDKSKLLTTICDSCSPNRDMNTFLWTDPHMGIHLNGQQKIQMNVRVSFNPAEISKNPFSETTTDSTSNSLFVEPGVDVLIPLYWLNKYDQAQAFQLDQIAFVQSVPKYIDIAFWVGLWIGLLLVVVGGVLIWRGLKIRKSHTAAGLLDNNQGDNASDVKPDPNYVETGDGTVGSVAVDNDFTEGTEGSNTLRNVQQV